MRILKLIISLLIAPLICSCMVHEAEKPGLPPVEVPEEYSETGTLTATADRWWEAFEDRELNRVIDRALRENLDVRQAWMRLAQARALARQAESPLWPQLDLQGSRTRSRNLAFPSEDAAVASHASRYSVTAPVAYEIDIWGRIRSAYYAAREDVKASRQDLESTAFVLTANVADLWFTIAELRSRLALIRQQVEVNKTLLELVQLRFDQGQATAVDVYQQKQQLATTQSLMPLVEAALRTSEHRLAVLLGRPPRKQVAELPTTLPRLPDPPRLGVPADLLQRRPEIRAVRHRITAADHRVGAAIADRLPALRITGNVGLLGPTPERMFANWLWSITTSVTAPVIDGGRRRAEVDRRQALLAELLLRYGQAFLNAIREVEDALVREQKQRRFIRDLSRRIEIAEGNLAASRDRFVNGLSDYLPVLTALQSLQTLQRSHIEARSQLFTIRIQLYLALGGTWPSELEEKPMEELLSLTKPGDEE